MLNVTEDDDVVLPLIPVDYFPRKPLVGASWKKGLDAVKYVLEPLGQWLNKRETEEYVNVLPPLTEIFRFTHYCRPEDVRVVLMSWEPYASFNKADGLAFSSLTCPLTKKQDSLDIIFEHIKTIYGQKPSSRDLTRWAKQGVLLPNMYLTTELNEPDAHAKLEWPSVIMHLLRVMIDSVKMRDAKSSIVFILLGSKIKKVKDWLTNYGADGHLFQYIHFLTAAHPSPANPKSRDFINSSTFMTCNNLLGAERAIKWVDVV